SASGFSHRGMILKADVMNTAPTTSDSPARMQTRLIEILPLSDFPGTIMSQVAGNAEGDE
ncbi:MAG: hypothetical protein ACXVBU_18335, partial [Ktedonobacteraceae bacterium]